MTVKQMEKMLQEVNRQVEKRHARHRIINTTFPRMERQLDISLDTMVKRNRESLSNPSILFGSTKVDPCDGECEE